jgi:hypothetical protein
MTARAFVIRRAPPIRSSVRPAAAPSGRDGAENSGFPHGIGRANFRDSFGYRPQNGRLCPNDAFAALIEATMAFKPTQIPADAKERSS